MEPDLPIPELERVIAQAPWRPSMLGWLGKAEARGKAEGKAAGKAEMLLRVLSLRALEPSASQRKRIERCTSDALFETWLERALTAESINAVLAPRRRAVSRTRTH